MLILQLTIWYCRRLPVYLKPIILWLAIRLQKKSAMLLSAIRANADYGLLLLLFARVSTAECDFQELQRDTIYAIKKINKNFLPTSVDEAKPADEKDM